MSTSPNLNLTNWSCACRSIPTDHDLTDVTCGRCGQSLVAEAPIALVADNDDGPRSPTHRNPPRAQQHGNLPPHVDLREVVYRWEYVETEGKRAIAAAARGEEYRRRLTGAPLAVAFNLLDHLRPGTWIACRSQEGIAADLGLKCDTVVAGLDVLYRAEFISKVYKRKNSQGGVFFEYQLNYAKLRVVQRETSRPRCDVLPITEKARPERGERPVPPPIAQVPSCNPAIARCPDCDGTGWKRLEGGAVRCGCRHFSIR